MTDRMAVRRGSRGARTVWRIAGVVLGLAGLALLPRAGAAPAMPDDVARGTAIARDADARDAGFGDFRVEVQMVLVDAQGERFERRLRLRQVEVAGDGDRSLILFDAPADVRGTVLLTHSHRAPPDDQWLFLPALRRVKRIAAAHQSGPFVGSEFAYEDLTAREPDRFRHRWLGEQPCGEGVCDRVERVPLDPDSGYGRQVVQYDRAHRRIIAIEFHDRADRPLKTLSTADWALHDGRFWKPARMHMVNHQTGRETLLIWQGFEFGTGADAGREFAPAALREVS